MPGFRQRAAQPRMDQARSGAVSRRAVAAFWSPHERPEAPAVSLEPHVMATYGRLPLALSHGRGCWLWDTQGRKYLDGLGGIAVNARPRPPEARAGAAQDQIGKIIHSSNYYHVPLQEQLAAKLCELSGLPRCSSAAPGWRPTRRRSRSRASSVTTAATPAPRSWSARRHSTAARSPPVGDRQPEDPGRLRAARRGDSCAFR